MVTLWTPGIGAASRRHHQARRCFPVTNMMNSDGSITQSWTDETGPQSVRVPAPNFDAMTASKEELDKFNIPPRPSDPSALRDWKSEYTRPVSLLTEVCTSDQYNGGNHR
jgi:hypothetical protein